MHDYDEGGAPINDKQQRLVDEYTASADHHLHYVLDSVIDEHADDRDIVDNLTAARNKLNVCIAILYDDDRARAGS